MVSFPFRISEPLAAIVRMGAWPFCMPKLLVDVAFLFVIICLSHTCWHVSIHMLWIFFPMFVMLALFCYFWIIGYDLCCSRCSVNWQCVYICMYVYVRVMTLLYEMWLYFFYVCLFYRYCFILSHDHISMHVTHTYTYALMAHRFLI